MSEHMFFQGNPSGKADDAPSELSTLSVLCELLGKVDALERRIARLEAENAKLRELVHDMYEDIVCGCAECFFSEYDEHRGKPSECGNGGCGYRQIADRMRKLGVDA